MSRDEADALITDLDNYLEARAKLEAGAQMASQDQVDMYRDILITTITELVK